MKNPKRSDGEPPEPLNARRQITLQLVRLLPVKNECRARILIDPLPETLDSNQSPIPERSRNYPLVGLER